MNDKQWRKAEQLAADHYFIVINREETEEGERYYIAYHPDLPGCRADGLTPEEAKIELAKARVDFIYFLLEDNLAVPEPKTYEIPIEHEQAGNYIDSLEQGKQIPYSGYLVEELTPA